MNPDFLDIIRALLDAEVRFIIVGAYAVNLYVDPRATGDLDIWIEPTPDNASKVMRALGEFGAPLTGVSEKDFSSPGITLQIGISPRRIDILTQISRPKEGRSRSLLCALSQTWNDLFDHSLLALGCEGDFSRFRCSDLVGLQQSRHRC